jgi:hypothetical protein
MAQNFDKSNSSGMGCLPLDSASQSPVMEKIGREDVFSLQTEGAAALKMLKSKILLMLRNLRVRTYKKTHKQWQMMLQTRVLS